MNGSNFSTFSSAEDAAGYSQLQTLYHLAVNDREAERQQVAAYLNDTAVQTLSALHIHFSLLPYRPRRPAAPRVSPGAAAAGRSDDRSDQLARELRPLELDSFGLHEALQMAAESG
jgi:signal transduction histidine kinase